ncbi:MAG: hypothetical protein AAB899_01475, partial [Patescibacteria group bacterium]
MQRNQITLLVTVIIIVIAGYFLVRSAKSPAGAPESPTSTSTSTSPASASTETGTTTTNITVGNLSILAAGGYTVKEIPIQNTAPKAPDYSAPLIFSASVGLAEDQKSALQARVAGLRAQLAEDPFNYTAWLALGRIFKSSGDYAQAEKMWKYVSLQWPTDATVLGNLGDLYMNFIRDYPKAEASYLGAIRNDARQVNAYRNLFQLYSVLYTTHASAAEDILKKGIENNPEA